MIVAIYHILQALHSYLLYFSLPGQIYSILFVYSQLLHSDNNPIHKTHMLESGELWYQQF